MNRQWFKSGVPWIWINAGAIAIAIVAVVGLLGLIMIRGMSHFWPAEVSEFKFQNKTQSTTIIAEIIETESIPAQTVPGFDHSTGLIDTTGLHS
ncbi:MAG: phosphate ABC transporter, permease protein PstA, partial [Methylococcales bacterium]|nr:phosphate ABC transporter, permease protein PstA [Methylococcales bacterium]